MTFQAMVGTNWSGNENLQLESGNSSTWILKSTMKQLSLCLYGLHKHIQIYYHPTQQILHIFPTPKNTSLQHLTAEFMFMSTIHKEAELGGEQK